MHNSVQYDFVQIFIACSLVTHDQKEHNICTDLRACANKKSSQSRILGNEGLIYVHLAPQL